MKDIAIDEIRQVRHQISAEYDHDLDKFFAFMMEEQKKYQPQINKYQELLGKQSEPLVLKDKPPERSK